MNRDAHRRDPRAQRVIPSGFAWSALRTVIAFATLSLGSSVGGAVWGIAASRLLKKTQMAVDTDQKDIPINSLDTIRDIRLNTIDNFNGEIDKPSNYLIDGVPSPKDTSLLTNEIILTKKDLKNINDNSDSQQIREKSLLPPRTLIGAIFSNDVEKVRQLLRESKTGTHPEEQYYHLSLELDMALQYDKTGVIIQQLLDAKANPNRQNADEYTPLMRVITAKPPFPVRSIEEKKSIIQMLIGAGTDLSVATKQGLTALDLAIWYRKPEEAKIIREEMAKKSSDVSPFDSFLKNYHAIKTHGHIQGLGDRAEKTIVSLPYPNRFSEDSKDTETQGTYTHWILPSLIKQLKNHKAKVASDEKKSETKADTVMPVSVMLEKIINAFQVASDFSNLKTSGDALVAHYQATNMLILPIDVNVNVSGKLLPHGLGVAFYKGEKDDELYMVYCNRGAGTRDGTNNTNIYKITKAEHAILESKLKNPDTWTMLFPPGYINETEFLAFLKGHIGSFSREEPEYRLKHKDQEHGTCAEANRKPLAEGFAFLMLQTTDNELTLHERAAKAKQIYKSFTADMRDGDLDELLGEFKKAKENGPEDITYKTCLDLFNHIIKEHHGSEEKTKRAEKMTGELGRVHKILINLDDTESRTVLMNVNITQLIIAAKSNHALTAMLFSIANEKFSYDWGALTKLYDDTNTPIPLSMVERWNNKLEAESGGRLRSSIRRAIDHYCSPSMIQALIQSGADPNLPNEEDKITPLRFVIVPVMRDDILEVLLKNGVNPNSFILENITPLSYAVERNGPSNDCLNTVLLLLKYNADPMMGSSPDKTSLAMALKDNNWTLVVVMLMAMDKVDLTKIDEEKRAAIQVHQVDLVNAAITLLKKYPDVQTRYFEKIENGSSALGAILQQTSSPANPSAFFKSPSENPLFQQLKMAFPLEKKEPAFAHTPPVTPIPGVR